MRDGYIIVDAVVHAYNLSKENSVSPITDRFNEAVYGFHNMLSPNNEYKLSKNEFLRDWGVKELERTAFLESDIDIVAYHSLPLFDYYKDGMSDIKKGDELRNRNPFRVILYGTINPFEGINALKNLEMQKKEYDIVGVKLYPAHYYKGKTLSMQLDNPNTGLSIIEKARELGINVIAVHKAIPFGLSHQKYYRLDDVEIVADKYPEMKFEIVHGGYAFVEETAFLLARFPNVYVNLEITASLIVNHPKRFAEILGKFLEAGAEDRILFGTGCVLVHPQPVIEKFIKFKMPDELVNEYGYPQVTDDIKRKILGENYLRMHGMNIDEVKTKIENDNIMKLKYERKFRPWGSIRGD